MNLRAIAFLVSGLIFAGAGTYVYFVVGKSGAKEAGASFGIDLSGTLLMPSIICWVVGAGLVLLGVLGLIQGGARSGELKQIAASGIETLGVITFLDRNYSLLLNNRPVYSIVEYRYRDSMGREYVKRADSIKTDLVIRSGWQVGSTIKVRYLPTEPAKSGIMFAEI